MRLFYTAWCISENEDTLSEKRNASYVSKEVKGTSVGDISEINTISLSSFICIIKYRNNCSIIPCFLKNAALPKHHMQNSKSHFYTCVEQELTTTQHRHNCSSVCGMKWHPGTVSLYSTSAIFWWLIPWHECLLGLVGWIIVWKKNAGMIEPSFSVILIVTCREWKSLLRPSSN